MRQVLWVSCHAHDISVSTWQHQSFEEVFIGVVCCQQWVRAAAGQALELHIPAPGAPCPRNTGISLRLRGLEHACLVLADLGSNGEIIFEGQYFKSPSAFSVFVKRKVRPQVSVSTCPLSAWLTSTG